LTMVATTRLEHAMVFNTLRTPVHMAYERWRVAEACGWGALVGA
jgi:hypothetical protein